MKNYNLSMPLTAECTVDVVYHSQGEAEIMLANESIAFIYSVEFTTKTFSDEHIHEQGEREFTECENVSYVDDKTVIWEDEDCIIIPKCLLGYADELFQHNIKLIQSKLNNEIQ